MITVDVNLLLYAVIDAFPQHKKARAWWESALNGTGQVGLGGPAIFGFLRIATNRRILNPPLPVDTAIGHVSDWLGRPNVTFLGLGHGTWKSHSICCRRLGRPATSPRMCGWRHTPSSMAPPCTATAPTSRDSENFAG